MATNLDSNAFNRTLLYDLLMIKTDVEITGKASSILNSLITRTIAAMTQEDVAWVENQVKNLD